jgi:hypothetical protein
MKEGSRMKRALVLMATVLLVSACIATVDDPVGDSKYPELDLIEAGVDYRTDVTKLWLTYSPDSDRSVGEWALWEEWSIVAEGEPHLWFAVYGQSYLVLPSNCGDGKIEEDQHTVTVTIDSACLEVDGKLPKIQIAGETWFRCFFFCPRDFDMMVDETDFTEPVIAWP